METNDTHEAATISTQPADFPSNRTGRSYKVRTIGAIVIVILLCAASFWGGIYASGPHSIGESTRANSSVCGSAFVLQYNNDIAKATQGQHTQKAYQDTIQAQAKNVRNLRDYDKDPTCLFVSYNAALEAKDTSVAERDSTKLLKLVQEGYYVNSQLSGLRSVSQMKSEIEATKSTHSDVGGG